MLPSSTTENSPVAYTQFLHWRHSLHLHATDSAFSCIPPQSATGGEKLFEANGSLLLPPADLLASLTDPTLLALCRLRLLLRAFGQKKSLSLPSRMTTVVTGQVLLAGPTPAGLAASFAALHVSLPRAVLFTAPRSHGLRVRHWLQRSPPTWPLLPDPQVQVALPSRFRNRDSGPAYIQKCRRVQVTWMLLLSGVKSFAEELSHGNF
jgi:hypothetical protein